MADDLEVFIAAGIDVPTAIVASEKPPERQSGCGVIVAVVAVALLLIVLRCL